MQLARPALSLLFALSRIARDSPLAIFLLHLSLPLPPSPAAAKTFTIKAKQHTKLGPGGADKSPVLIPLAVGLLGPEGEGGAVNRC